MPDTKETCTAALIAAEGWQCERCALAWDEDDAAPACQPLTYGRLIMAAESEAERLAQSMRAILEIRPEQKFRNKGQLKARMEFLALAKLAEKLRNDSNKQLNAQS